MHLKRVLVRLTPRRSRMYLPLALILSLFLVVFIPLAAGDGKRDVRASIYASRTEASPGDNVTFWIWIEPLKERARKLVITEAALNGLDVVSSTAPASCLQTTGTWVCVQDDSHPFGIGVQVVVKPGTEGQDLTYAAQVKVWNNGDDEGEKSDPITASADVRSVPASVTAQPEIDVRLNATEAAMVPGTPVTYRVEVTNRGTEAARNVSVVVTVPATLVLLSASPWPSRQNDRLTWILDSVPVGSTELLFNVTLPASTQLQQLDTAIAVRYGDGNGRDVLAQTIPSAVRVLPIPQAPLISPVQAGIVLAVVAFVVRFVLLPPGPIGAFSSGVSGAEEIFLLHRSGVLLRHFSSTGTEAIDSDILGGMLAAVRMFIEDSMRPPAGALQEIRFSGGSIVFVTGKNAALAAVNARGNRSRFAQRASGLLREFEALNGDALVNFDGGASPLEGVEALLGGIGA